MIKAARISMFVNAALFIFGAIQHFGVPIGSFAEPKIIPAGIVEAGCAAALLFGGFALSPDGTRGRRAAIFANGIALAGVVLGVVALALGAGPRTRSNDIYHLVMLVLIGLALTALFGKRARA